jgi:hypothetical protein
MADGTNHALYLNIATLIFSVLTFVLFAGTIIAAVILVPQWVEDTTDDVSDNVNDNVNSTVSSSNTS